MLDSRRSWWSLPLLLLLAGCRWWLLLLMQLLLSEQLVLLNRQLLPLFILLLLQLPLLRLRHRHLRYTLLMVAVVVKPNGTLAGAAVRDERRLMRLMVAAEVCRRRRHAFVVAAELQPMLALELIQIEVIYVHPAESGVKNHWISVAVVRKGERLEHVGMYTRRRIDERQIVVVVGSHNYVGRSVAAGCLLVVDAVCVCSDRWSKLQKKQYEQ